MWNGLDFVNCSQRVFASRRTRYAELKNSDLTRPNDAKTKTAPVIILFEVVARWIVPAKATTSIRSAVRRTCPIYPRKINFRFITFARARVTWQIIRRVIKKIIFIYSGTRTTPRTRMDVQSDNPRTTPVFRASK